MLLSILKFWREGLLVVLVGLLWLSHSQNSLLSEEVKMNKAQYQEYKGKYEDVQHQMDIINQSIEDQKVKLKESEVARQKIITSLTGQVNILRKQTPPKDCQKAVDWAITQKDDLAWPKQ